MSTSVELRPKAIEAGYGSPLDFRTRLAIGVGLLLGLTLLLIVHVQQMWSQSHYQYFPFVVAAMAWFLWSRWKEGVGTVGPRAGAAWGAEVAVAAVSLGALGNANDGFGEHSKLFTYRNSVTNRQATISVDYPFLRGWHELTSCYRSAGWELTDRGVRAAKSDDGKQNWNFVQAEFEKPGGEFGFLTYTFIDSLGNRISPPVDELWEKLIERVLRRGPYSLGSRYYQLQAWTAGSGQLDEAGKQAVQELFLTCRERFRDHFANATENK